jgi:hypothetical protein
MSRRTASAIKTRDGGSKAFLLPVRQTNDANYSESVACRQLLWRFCPWSNCCQICQLNNRNLIVSRVEIIYNLAFMNPKFMACGLLNTALE